MPGVKVKAMNATKRIRSGLAAIALGGALILGGCGEDDVNNARDDLQQEAEDFTQGIPDEAQDARQQAEDAADQIQQQIDELEGGN